MVLVDFDDSLASTFRQLNLEWVTRYFEVEPADERVLSNPRKEIIDKGGFVYFIKMENEIAGTFALIYVGEGIFELSKMAVAEKLRGKNIGNKMLEFCLHKAKDLKAQKLILYSNTKLETAIHLYKKFGFVEVPLKGADYKRANIKMEIEIK